MYNYVNLKSLRWIINSQSGDGEITFGWCHYIKESHKNIKLNLFVWDSSPSSSTDLKIVKVNEAWCVNILQIKSASTEYEKFMWICQQLIPQFITNEARKDFVYETDTQTICTTINYYRCFSIGFSLFNYLQRTTNFPYSHTIIYKQTKER